MVTAPVQDCHHCAARRGAESHIVFEMTAQPQQASRSEAGYPRLRDLSLRDWFDVLKRAGKAMLADNMLMIGQALAYSTFFAIPSVLLLAVGLFTLVSGPETIDTLMNHLRGVMPAEATQLVSDSLHRLDTQQRASILMIVVGAGLALWSTTGAMTTYMTAVNMAYERKDRRRFVKKRLVAGLMVAVIGTAFLLVAALLIFGPPIEKHVRDSIGGGSTLDWVWWAAQWPILILGLLAAFAALLYLGPDVDHRSWRFLTPGSVIAVVIWLVTSGGFAYYTANFGSYNKAWGSFAAVIIMLVWLWLTALALLFGAEVNAELERGIATKI